MDCIVSNNYEEVCKNDVMFVNDSWNVKWRK